MAQGSAVEGVSTDWHLVHLGSRAVGGLGLIMVEDTAVESRGRITLGHLGLWDDAHISGLARITKFITQSGAIPGIEIAHAGRKGSCRFTWEGGRPLTIEQGGWETVAPSAGPFRIGDPIPRELTIAEIQELKDAFVTAAHRAVKTGFRVLEIHAAHGYLLNQFLSPLTNHRSDKYGGSRDNRMRLLLELVEEIRAIWPEDLPLFVRISATDWVVGGWTIEDSIVLAARLAERGVDLVDCSSGGILPDAPIPVEPGYQVGFAERIRRTAKVRTAAVGLITFPQEAESIIASEKADLVLIGRALLGDPYWAIRAAITLEHIPDDLVPIQYRDAW